MLVKVAFVEGTGLDKGIMARMPLHVPCGERSRGFLSGCVCDRADGRGKDKQDEDRGSSHFSDRPEARR